MPTYSEPVNRRRRFPWWAKLILLVVVLYGAALYVAAHQAKVYLNAVVAPPGTGRKNAQNSISAAFRLESPPSASPRNSSIPSRDLISAPAPSAPRPLFMIPGTPRSRSQAQ